MIPSTDMWVLVDEPASVALVSELRAAGFRACVYVVSTTNATEVETKALEAGADGYSCAPIESSSLAARFRATLRNKSGKYRTTSPTKLSLRRQERVLFVGPHPYALTQRELALVDYLQIRAGQWVERDELLSALFGAQSGHDSSLLRTHIWNIRKKLGLHGELLRSDRLRGVMLVDGIEEVE
jgi:two-component system response regulator TctD